MELTRRSKPVRRPKGRRDSRLSPKSDFGPIDFPEQAIRSTAAAIQDLYDSRRGMAAAKPCGQGSQMQL